MPKKLAQVYGHVVSVEAFESTEKKNTYDGKVKCPRCGILVASAGSTTIKAAHRQTMKNIGHHMDKHHKKPLR